ncbi:hypothetical protein AURDEDRAFT_114221 [Auricularia subglabra TFB-10046 SS5]|nr:hypothetical protein AURDEDRAFT_114221 [Auricularia subglabra TFB-10046 SS5]
MQRYTAMSTSYSSNPVDIEPAFLVEPAADAKPIEIERADFNKTALKERRNAYAAVLDNVLSPSECEQLIRYAEASSTTDPAWQVALVNSGPGQEAYVPEYRNSQRIIWDDQRMMDLLWARCLQAPGLADDIVKLEGAGKSHIIGPQAVKKNQRWRFTRLNERMRFLRYEKGMFFREHCDGSYYEPKTEEKSFYTLHLYLNDSAEGLADQHKFSVPQQPGVLSRLASKISGSPSAQDPPLHMPQLSGGATTFYTDDMAEQIDVFPRAGRVLLFQHRALLHAGADVHAGVKYTMRTDLMFERISEPDD